VSGCLEFRRRVGAEPFAPDAAIEAHRRECPACSRHQDELRAMDALVRRALAVNLPPATARAAAAEAPATRRLRRAFAIAASLVGGVAVGVVLLVGAPRASIAREVVGHVQHEPGAMDTTAPVGAAALAGVLDEDGLRLRPGIGDVTFAARCVFDGRVVPHLVVRTAEGPVTVLLLRHRTVARAQRIDEQGYEAVVMPAPRGAIAVIGQDVADLDGVARKVAEAVDFGR
jgi:hypothetical protein